MARFLIAMLCLCGLLAGCTDRDASIFIGGNVAPDDECVFNVENNMELDGILDTALTDEYFVYPLYFNQLVGRGSTTNLMADPNGVQIQGAEVEIRTSDGAPIAFGGLANPFTVVSSTFVPSTTQGVIGKAVGQITVIPAAYGQQLRDINGTGTNRLQIVVAVTPFGITNGDVEVEGGEWIWPLTICYGCLVTFPPDADDPTTAGSICDSSEPPQDQLCVGGQNAPVDCRFCRGLTVCER